MLKKIKQWFRQFTYFTMGEPYFFCNWCGEIDLMDNGVFYVVKNNEEYYCETCHKCLEKHLQYVEEYEDYELKPNTQFPNGAFLISGRDFDSVEVK